MIYLCAQPDDLYFLWQLEVLLHNLRSLQVPGSSIHVLLGYRPEVGLKPQFRELINSNPDITFYTYADNRVNSAYKSSIRPHIIARHFRAFPELEKEQVFYHDADIIFRALPDFAKVAQSDIWYMSETSSYISSKYIKDRAGEEFFLSMCAVVGVDPVVVCSHDNNCGGAQYLLRDVTAAFWEELETVCERLFSLMMQFNEGLESGGIQAWCADMWGIYWMALRDGRKVKVSDELAFCWPFEFAFRWHKTKILHNAGVTREQSEKYFYKGIYTARMPYFDDLSFVTKDHCSWYYVKAMEAYFNEKKKIDLQDVGFLIIVRIDSPCRLLNIRAIVNFLHVNFSTHIYILESDAEQKLHEKWPAGVDYTFLEDKQLLFNRGRLNNYLLRKCRQPIAAIYDADIITPAAQMLAACALIRSGHADISSPYDGTVYAVDSFFKGIFLETLQEQILSHNSAKFPITTRRAVGGVVFVKREQYLMLGGENRKIYSWGPDDQERVKRMQLLGYTFRRIPGPIYHLPHARGVNSSYSSLAHWRNHMGEYFKICAMEKSHLQAYIQDNLVFH